MDKIQKQEKQIFDAIQLLKDAVFGMESSYAPYCYFSTAQVRKLDVDKMRQFIEELLLLASQDSRYSSDLESLIKDFLLITLNYLDCTFASNEYKFSSIRKIAYATWKQAENQTSTFDILITDVEKNISSECFDLYKQFTKQIITVDQDAFYICVKHSLEKFVDNHGLNCIGDEDAVDQMTSRIRQLAFRINVDSKRFIRARAENSHGE